jgi:hypothetical protein
MLVVDYSQQSGLMIQKWMITFARALSLVQKIALSILTRLRNGKSAAACCVNGVGNSAVALTKL